MKKTVIIAIFIVYLASILAVQFFGYPATIPESGVYIEGITITDVTLSNRQDGQSTTVNKGADKTSGLTAYSFKFIAGEYTMDNLEENPNRVKIEYLLDPVDADPSYLVYVLNNQNVVVLEETAELVFLKRGSTNLALKEAKANVHARAEIIIVAY
ncbi:MAG: hypothetical protein E7343_02555 [Clostridiales bacterium]|nr:hypothetical protein [Clostridiales bacterium]